MKINLIIGGETKTFSSPFISARVLRDTIAKANSPEMNNVNETLVDEMAGYIAKVYGDQFTVDQVLDGIASDQLIPEFQRTIDGVMGSLNGKLVKLQDPNSQAGSQ